MGLCDHYQTLPLTDLGLERLVMLFMKLGDFRKVSFSPGRCTSRRYTCSRRRFVLASTVHHHTDQRTRCDDPPSQGNSQEKTELADPV
jgi:hypothetical protein